ncbi:hypothetical protein ACIOUE_32265 [Streptomyces xanthochromogenes]|uniref:hypothetical protein n=1 Tax=Streptomyces xanthochromogenes TaxID=67384 RepID=UPI0037FEE9CD
MPASRVSAGTIAAQLSTLGLPTRVEEHERQTAIEAEVPDGLPAETWQRALDVVAQADRFGLLATSLGGRTLWAAVRKPTLASDRSPGPGQQR